MGKYLNRDKTLKRFNFIMMLYRTSTEEDAFIETYHEKKPFSRHELCTLLYIYTELLDFRDNDEVDRNVFDSLFSGYCVDLLKHVNGVITNHLEELAKK